MLLATCFLLHSTANKEGKKQMANSKESPYNASKQDHFGS